MSPNLRAVCKESRLRVYLLEPQGRRKAILGGRGSEGAVTENSASQIWEALGPVTSQVRALFTFRALPTDLPPPYALHS